MYAASGFTAAAFVLCTLAAGVSPSHGRQPATTSPAAEAAKDAGWPRQFESRTHIVRIHQPQVDAWPNFDRITFRAAVVLQPKGSDELTYGVMVASARADVAFEERLVMLTDRKIEELTFPGADDAMNADLARIVTEAMPPQRTQTVSLDRIIAELDASEVSIRKVEVNLAPPKIVASTKPAAMVTFMGKPRFTQAPGSPLMVAINTNWDVFLDPAQSRYFLLHEDSWFSSGTLESGGWTPVPAPDGLATLPDDPNWSDVRAAIPGKPPALVPGIFISFEPAELVVTDGAPEMQPIPGTKLMMVVNTENDLFFNAQQSQFYLLAAGRWFSAPSLDGPWSSASGSLPDDFRNIPDDSDAADVLPSVPGTAAANEAIVMASLPNRATVNTADLKLAVTYDGAPDFRPIESTTVLYAHNSPFSVFLVDQRYYCCHDAVWFVSPSASGEWTVATSIPAAIYTIPPSSPKHNVTYVTVYESTPTTVTTSYTAGYTGAQVAATGAVMFGLGMIVGDLLDDDDCCWHYHYHSHFFSYGCGARWHGHHGGWACVGRRYGPYGGCGGFACYNPSTGRFARGGYAYGPRGVAGWRAAYNPSSGVFGYRAGASTPYGSWGRAAISNGDDWVRAGYRSGPRGSVSGIEGSGGAGAIHGEGRFGNGVTVARDRDGDVYAGKDGKVYKKTDDGWENKTAASPKARPATNDAASPVPQEYLKDQSNSRERGERNANRPRSGRDADSRRGRAPSGGRR
jgi:hypothetical protein